MFRFRKKSNQKELIVGVNITGYFVNIVLLQKENNKNTIEDFVSESIPQDIEKEKVDNFVITTLKNYFSKLKTPKFKVFSLILESETIIRRIQIPKISSKELLEAVKWEIKTHIPFSVENAAISFSILGEIKSKEGAKYDLLVAVVQKESIERTKTIFEKASIHLDSLTIAPFAVWNLLKAGDILKKEQRTAFVEIGSENTKIIFFDGESLDFYREIPIGGMHFTKSMIGLFVADKWQMNLDYRQAEKLKIKYGIPDENTTEVTEEGLPLKQIYQVLRPTLRRFLNEINRSFNYYKEQFSKVSIDRVILSGENSKIKNLDLHLSSEIGVKIEKIEDLLKIEKGQTIKDLNEFLLSIPNIALAIGVALLQNKEMDFTSKGVSGNILSGKIEIERLTPSKQTAIAIVGLIALSYILTLYLVTTNVENTIKKYEKLIKEQRLLLLNLKLLKDKEETLSKIESQKNYLRPLIVEIANIMPTKVNLDTFTFNNSTKSFAISGTSKDMFSVGNFLKKLESSSYFDNVFLVEAKKTGDENIYKFSITFTLKGKI